MHSMFEKLPDEILHRIFSNVQSSIFDTQLVTTLPLVCKKWREVLYLQGGHHSPSPFAELK